MEISNTKLEVPKWVCVLAILLSTVALCVQATIDVYQNVNRNMDWVAWFTQVWTMSLPTGYTLVFAAIGGCLLYANRWFLALLLYSLVGCYMAYTASNSMDFMSNQTVAVTQSQIQQRTVSKDIAEIKNRIILEERKEANENLWRTYTTAKTPADKEKVLAQIKAAASEPLALQQADIDVVPVGVGGTANKYLGWRPEAIQEAKAFVFPILIMIGKALGITLGFACWPTPSPEQWKARPPAPLVAHTFTESFRKLSYDEAKDDLLSMIAVGARIDSQRELSERWGVGEGTVSKWLPRLKKDGVPIRLEANGNRRAIVGVPHVNGNGRIAGNA